MGFDAYRAGVPLPIGEEETPNHRGKYIYTACEFTPTISARTPLPPALGLHRTGLSKLKITRAACQLPPQITNHVYACTVRQSLLA